ncbi:MAG: GNAT family N-acetyltransferase [Firmicutes bacterium]|jgi:phosphinothricin acetyltransferase|nr:GNAT family N-acetyltransferase [Bacillota bacterium]
MTQAPGITIRRAVPDDAGAICEISSHIWDGHDYIPNVVDRWVADDTGAFLVAELDGHVRGYGKLTLHTPLDGWLEGLRVDVGFRRRGLARALSCALVDHARALGLHTLRFATSVDNVESIALNERAGFRRIAGFRYLFAAEREILAVGTPDGHRLDTADPAVERLTDPAEVAQFVLSSDLVRMSGGLFPGGFVFQEATPETVMAIIGRAECLGIRHPKPDRTLAAVLIVESSHEGSVDNPGLVIRFLEGEPSASGALARWTLWYAHSRGISYIDVSTPCGHPSTPALVEAGFENWHSEVPESLPTILVFEYPPEVLRGL